jgi:tetratricopeptide (TPR) repeat protein
MPANEVQWQPALVVLALALALGAFLAWRLRRGGTAPASTAAPEGVPLVLRDLDGRVESLLAQLRELEATAAKRTPDQLARERYALELEAARALQARESLARKTGAASASAPSAAAPPPGGAARGFLWGAASMAAIALLVVLVWQSAERRPEGGSVTGTVPGAGRSAESGESAAPGDAASDGTLAELRARLEEKPEDHDARLDLARQLLLRRDLMGVWNETQQVLAKSPGHPRALSYQALVRLAMGQGEVAVEMLKQAIAAAPELMEARQNLVFVYASLGRTKDAEAAIAEVARRSPQDGERLREALATFERERPGGGAEAGADPHADIAPPASASGPDPHADVAPPAAAGAQPAPAGPGSAGVFGWIEADATVARRVPAGTVVFVTVRPAGVAQGPPVAVKRLVSESLPLQFELGAGDSMMGQPLPDPMRIDVRADSDGDPMTRPASDPAGSADGVALGKTGVRIVLR